MFEILRQSLALGVVTSDYPLTPAAVSDRARGRPEIDYPRWRDARAAVAACPTAALTATDQAGERTTVLDLAHCIYCGCCAEADPAIRMTSDGELAAGRRVDLRATARYRLGPDGSHARLLEVVPAGLDAPGATELLGQALRERIQRTLGRSLHVRQVDAGSCNGCEIEIGGLNSPVYDVERFGVHFVPSPRHADLLLVTGPVTRNMELALRKTYQATPEPRCVVAVGTCGCGGGIYGRNYATRGGVDQVIPVDLYVPGCPPHPHALLRGLLLALGQWPARAQPNPRVK